MTDPELEPLPDGVLETLRKVSTSTIATQLYKRGFRQPQLLGVKPLSEVADGFVGEAFTMRFIPMREDVDGLDPYRSGNTLQWEAFEALQPGQVLVVDSYRTATAASGGDMLMTRAWKRGAAAVVTDGGLRDGHVLAQLPFPTYASQVTITTRAAQHHVADLNVPIGCAGVAVYPGDVLIGDRDGVLVIPRHLAAEVAEQGLEQEQLEAYVSTKIHAGEPLWGNYPPGEGRRPTAAPTTDPESGRKRTEPSVCQHFPHDIAVRLLAGCQQRGKIDEDRRFAKSLRALAAGRGLRHSAACSSQGGAADPVWWRQPAAARP